MCKIFVIILAIIIDVAPLYYKDVFTDDDTEWKYNGRCTRRYTPGICAMSVVVVWTFVFQIQNCTERLGCPTASRTNRFPTYHRCMRRCHSLAELYAQVLAAGGRSDVDIARNASQGRRQGDTDSEVYQTTEEESEPEYHDEVGDPALVNPPGYKYLSSLEEIIPPDIDAVRSEHLPNPYDLFHDAFGSN